MSEPQCKANVYISKFRIQQITLKLTTARNQCTLLSLIGIITFETVQHTYKVITSLSCRNFNHHHSGENKTFFLLLFSFYGKGGGCVRDHTVKDAAKGCVITLSRSKIFIRLVHLWYSLSVRFLSTTARFGGILEKKIETKTKNTANTSEFLKTLL